VIDVTWQSCAAMYQGSSARHGERAWVDDVPSSM
jgi:hypothetical protein